MTIEHARKIINFVKERLEKKMDVEQIEWELANEFNVDDN